MITQLDYLAVKEVIRLLPEYSKNLDFDIIGVAYMNVLEDEYERLQTKQPRGYAHAERDSRPRANQEAEGVCPTA